MRGLAKSLIGAMPWGLKYEIFYQMARALGVTAYQANGSSGPIFGHMYDQTLIKSYLRDGEWSSDITGMIAAVLKNGGTFYDIGANVGTVIIPVAANRAVRCVGFEPEPGNFALLSANVHAQGAPNIELHNLAVADKAGSMGFTKSAYNSGDHRLAQGLGDIQVGAQALDAFPLPAGPFVAKIDTQGAEPLIFQGGETTLAGADLIISEFWPWGMKRMGLEPGPVLEFAQRHFTRGYVLRHGKKMGEPKPIGTVLSELEAIVARGGEFDQADLILVK